MDRAPTCENCSGGDAGGPHSYGWDCRAIERPLLKPEPQKQMREPETVEKAGIPLLCRIGWHYWERWTDCEVTVVHRPSSRYSWKSDRPGQTRKCYRCGLKEYR